VIVDHERAFIVYFTHPQAKAPAGELYPGRRSTVFAAEVDVSDGQVVCHRSRDVSL
jgi:hypothetical protein